MIEKFQHVGYDITLKQPVGYECGDEKPYSISFKKDGEWVHKGIHVSKYKMKDGLWVKGRSKSDIESEAKDKLLEWVDTL